MNSQPAHSGDTVRAIVYSVLTMVTNDDCDLSDVIVTGNFVLQFYLWIRHFPPIV